MKSILFPSFDAGRVLLKVFFQFLFQKNLNFLASCFVMLTFVYFSTEFTQNSLEQNLLGLCKNLCDKGIL